MGWRLGLGLGFFVCVRRRRIGASRIGVVKEGKGRDKDKEIEREDKGGRKVELKGSGKFLGGG